MNQVKRFTLAHGVFVSLVLHACLVLPPVLWMTHTPRKRARNVNRLNVELFGMLSNRQVAAQVKRIESLRPSSPTKQKPDDPKPKTEVAPPKEIAHTELHTTPSNFPADFPNVVKLPAAPSTTTTENSQASGGPSRPGGDSNQMQQYIGRRNTEADLINTYIRQLTKQAKDHLIYPKEAQKKRLEGVSEVSFVVTETGEIKPNTLKITRSSGSALLDNSALKTITSVAPFPSGLIFRWIANRCMPSTTMRSTTR